MIPKLPTYNKQIIEKYSPLEKLAKNKKHENTNLK